MYCIVEEVEQYFAAVPRLNNATGVNKYRKDENSKERRMEGNQETKVMTEAEYRASIGKKNYQWIRCALGLHKLEVIDSKPIDNIRSEVVGNIIISRCACCGKIKTKTIYTKDIR